MVDLIKNEGVHVIIGPEYSSQAKFLIDLGGKVHVSIISFSPNSPFLSPAQTHYVVRTAQDDAFKVQAIAAIVQAYGWREIVIIYEDTECGNGLFPRLLHEFQGIDTRVPCASNISLSSTDNEIKAELGNLKKMEKIIFLVHMTARIGSRLFILAHENGMVSEGYAWLVTEGLSNLLDPVGAKAMHSMQGVLGVRPWIPSSEELDIFKSKLQANQKSCKFNLFGLWAYDTVKAIAMAAENAGIADLTFSNQNSSKGKVDLEDLGVSEMGPRILKFIENITFPGLTGEFRLDNRQLIPSPFEVFNVIGETERVIGYWTQEKGFSPNLRNASTRNQLKHPIWPGDTTKLPKKLRIGLPLVKIGFTEFIKAEWQPNSNGATACEDQESTIVSGLFIISGVASMFAFLANVAKFFYFHWPDSNPANQERSLWWKCLEMAKYFDQKDLSSHHFKVSHQSRVHPITNPESSNIGPLQAYDAIDNVQNHSRTSQEVAEDIVRDGGHENLDLDRHPGPTNALHLH